VIYEKAKEMAMDFGSQPEHGRAQRVVTQQRSHSAPNMAELPVGIWESGDGLGGVVGIKLATHYHDGSGDIPVDLELTFDSNKDLWTGHFHRRAFDGDVTLSRAPDRPTYDLEICFEIVPHQTIRIW
jgi:hypothetical protein